MNIAIMNRAILLNEEGTGEPLRLLENARRVVRFDVVSNGGRRPLTDEQRRAIFAKSGSRGSERAEAAARALPPWQKPQGGDRWGSEIRATTVWDKADRLLGRLMRVGDVTTTLTEDDPKWKWVLGTAAGMMLPTPGGKFKALGKVDDAADTAKGIWALARNSLARKLGLSDDLRKGLPGITDHLDNILTKTDDYDGILKQAAKDYKNGDRYIRLPDIEQKVAPVADRMAAARIQGAVQDAERLSASIPAGHYDTALDLADKRVIDAVAAGDAPTKQYLEELWWDKKDLFRDPTTMWVNYSEMADYLKGVVSGAGKSTVVSGMPVAPLAKLKVAEAAAEAKESAYDYARKMNFDNSWLWKDIPNRSATETLFANVLRVTRFDVLANAALSDAQRRAIFAKSGGRGAAGGGSYLPSGNGRNTRFNNPNPGQNRITGQATSNLSGTSDYDRLKDQDDLRMKESILRSQNMGQGLSGEQQDWLARAQAEYKSTANLRLDPWAGGAPGSGVPVGHGGYSVLSPHYQSPPTGPWQGNAREAGDGAGSLLAEQGTVPQWDPIQHKFIEPPSPTPPLRIGPRPAVMPSKTVVPPLNGLLPKQPRKDDKIFIGGTPRFDEKTGKYRNDSRVAPFDVLANAIQSDSQRRAVFAKMRYSSTGGNTGSASQGGGTSRQAVASPQATATQTATGGGSGPLVAIPANPNAGKMVASATRETVAELRMAQAAQAAESALQAYGPTSNQYIDALERSIAAREEYQKTATSVEDLLKSALSAPKEVDPVTVQPVKPKEQVVTAQTEVDPSPPRLMDPKKQPTGNGLIQIPNKLTQERMKKIMARYR